MLESVIVLRDALYDLPGGFKDTARVYREDLAGAAPTSVEYGSDALMFVERALFNRNSLASTLPESVFAPRLVADRERQLAFRCAAAEFGASAFTAKGVDLEELTGDKLRRARESYGNSPLRLAEKGDDKLRQEFCKGWPPAAYDKKTIAQLRALRERYADAFDADELDRFLARAERDRARFESMEPGADAFKKMLQTERGQDSMLWGLDLWDRFDADPELGRSPVAELVARLAGVFRTQGHSEAAVRYFERTTLDSFDAYRASFMECDALWNARKGAVIYNVVISAFFGPKQALRDCYAAETARTELTGFVPRELAAAGPLVRGGGEALVRQILPGNVTYLARVVNLDALPERGCALLFVIGREFGGEARPLPAYGAEGCDELAGAVRGADAELEAAAVAFAFSDEAHACETNENFYPTDQPADSARHVAVCAVDGRVVLVDLASSNGTTLGRADGSQVDLGHDPAMGERPAAAAYRGDRIYLGDSEFEIL